MNTEDVKGLVCPKCNADWLHLELEDYGYDCKRCGNFLRKDDEYYVDFKKRLRLDKLLKKFGNKCAEGVLWYIGDFDISYKHNSFYIGKHIFKIGTIEDIIFDLETYNSK